MTRPFTKDSLHDLVYRMRSEVLAESDPRRASGLRDSADAIDALLVDIGRCQDVVTGIQATLKQLFPDPHVAKLLRNHSELLHRMSDAQVLLVNDTVIRPEARTQLLSMIAKVREAFEQVVVERDELWRELESTQRMLAQAQRDDGEPT
jgi:hypothetical protein